MPTPMVSESPLTAPPDRQFQRKPLSYQRSSLNEGVLMIRLFQTIAVVMVSLFAGTTSFALPACPTDQTKRFHNCFGTYVNGDGDIYVGEFQDDEFHGQGILYYGGGAFNGDQYVGGFKNNQRHGLGTYYYLAENENKGDVFFGMFKEDLANGVGTYRWADGEYDVVEYRDDAPNGQGTSYYSDGTVKYIGAYKDDEFHGYGTYFYEDGSKEVGEFKFSKLNGYAIEIGPNGRVIRQGIYKDDEFQYQSYFPNKSELQGNEVADASALEKSKSACTEIGLEPGSGNFGKCVLRFLKLAD